MRTKALLCAAGLLAAVATSMAQSNVYSLNVVGYSTVTLTNTTAGNSGFQILANQLHSDSTGTNNTITGTLGTNWNALTSAYMFSTTAGFKIATFIGGAWNTGNAADTAIINAGLNAGGAFWLKNNGPTGPTSLTFVGEVHQGSTALPIAVGFQLVSITTPQSLSLEASPYPAYPKSALDTAYLYSTTTGFGGAAAGADHGTFTVLSGNFNPANPTPKVGQGFWIKSTAAKTWTQTYNVPQ